MIEVTNPNEFLWVEKYRPDTVANCILPKAIKDIAVGIVAKGNTPNLLLAGGAGTGKTTLARALCNELDCDMMFINGSNEGRLFDTLRNRIANFSSTVSLSDAGRKVVIIDEADYIPADTVQPALRSFIEEFSSNCGFIFTCNFKHKIMDALHSRGAVIDYVIPKEEKPEIAKQIHNRICQILTQEGVLFDKKVVAEFVFKSFPDIRKMLNAIQVKSITGTLDASILTNNIESDMIELVKSLKEKDFGTVRKWVANNPNLDLANITKNFYDTSYTFIKADSIPQLILILNDYSYKNAFVTDTEINIMAMFVEIMANVEFA